MTQQPPNDPYRDLGPHPQAPRQQPPLPPQMPPGQPVPPQQQFPQAGSQPPHPQQPPHPAQPHPAQQHPSQPQQMSPWQELRQPGVVSGAVKDGMKSWAKGKLLGYGVMAAIVLLVGGPVFLWSMFGRGGGDSTSSETRDDEPAATSAAAPGDSTEGDSTEGDDTSSEQPADPGVLQFTLPDGWRAEKEGTSESGIKEYQVRQGDTWTILLAGYKPVEQDMTLAERCQEATQFETSGDQGNVEPVSISQSGDEAVKCEVSVNDAAMGGQEAVVTYYFLQKPGEDRYIEMRLSGPTPTNDLDITPADVKRTRDEGMQIVRGTASAAGFEINP
ncbi:MAG: hypothetical protein E7L00_04325 [Propionibacteriaceae bacterium]|nr:hypothetical protein [Propionibacteriaceae bacterium]